MAYALVLIMQLLGGLLGLAAGLVALLIGGAGTMLGLGLAGVIVVLVLLGVVLSPWFLLGLAAWAVWRILAPGRPRRRTWYVVR
ncbi:MAG: hypothetical protein R6U88_05875 [Candidatus Bipolaricaulota bacterium]